jgi:hypothetical protein
VVDVTTTVTVESEDELAVVLGLALDNVVATFEDVVGFSRTTIPSPSPSNVCSILSI